ncbi:hypothetical protein [Chitinophaga japonensis]|uniref:Uncharacterized protein n=1 Tax=Chitinophaga japonensis TaxID=104662 RepID=A0A562T4Z5_CHIJA|nr:hypothetical protein [Chitinophaga japonensis]TWI88582.1 hypothetical protein LX66_2668 [Chitinophaga japonensis]
MDNYIVLIPLLMLVIGVVVIYVAILRWVFRINHICDRLSAISHNLFELRQSIEKKLEEDTVAATGSQR